MRIPFYFILACLLSSFCLAQEMSKDERKLVNRYLKDMKNKDESARYDAVERLSLYEYEEVATALASALSDASPRVRNRAALSLYELKDAARPAIPAMQTALHQDPDPWVKINAGAALFNLKENRQQITGEILKLLNNPDANVQIAAAHFLVNEVPDSELIPVLRNAVKNPDETVRINASKVFLEFDPLSAAALPILVDALKDPNAKVRANSAAAIEKLKSKASSALPALIAALKDPEASVRSASASAIGSMGTWGKAAIPSLQSLITSDADANVRRNCLRVLEWIDPEGKQSMPLILAALKDSSLDVRREALDAMLSIRPFPSDSVPAVKAALSGETNEDVKRDLDRVMERGEKDKEFNASIKTGKQPVAPKPGMAKEEAEKILQEEGVQMTDEELWRRVGDADVKIVKAMLAAGISPNSERQGMSVLTRAVSFYKGTPEQRQIVETLIDSGADVNYRGTNEVTPFFYAAGKCEPDLLQKMIQAGAILEVKATGGATTLTEAALANKIENVRLLLKSGYKLKNEPSWLMQSTKNTEILALLRKAGAK